MEQQSENRTKRKTPQEKLVTRRQKLSESYAQLDKQREAWLAQGEKLKEEENRLQAEADKIVIETVNLLDLKELIFEKSLDSLSREDIVKAVSTPALGGRKDGGM